MYAALVWYQKEHHACAGASEHQARWGRPARPASRTRAPANTSPARPASPYAGGNRRLQGPARGLFLCAGNGLLRLSGSGVAGAGREGRALFACAHSSASRGRGEGGRAGRAAPLSGPGGPPGLAARATRRPKRRARARRRRDASELWTSTAGRGPACAVNGNTVVSPAFAADAGPRAASVLCIPSRAGERHAKQREAARGLAGAASTRPPGGLRSPGRRLPPLQPGVGAGLSRRPTRGANPKRQPQTCYSCSRTEAFPMLPIARGSGISGRGWPVVTFRPGWQHPPEGVPGWETSVWRREPGMPSAQASRKGTSGRPGRARAECPVRAEPGTRNRAAGRGAHVPTDRAPEGAAIQDRFIFRPVVIWIVSILSRGHLRPRGCARSPEAGGRPGNMRVRRRGLRCLDIAPFLNGPTGCRPGRVWAFWGYLATGGRSFWARAESRVRPAGARSRGGQKRRGLQGRVDPGAFHRGEQRFSPGTG